MGYPVREVLRVFGFTGPSLELLKQEVEEAHTELLALLDADLANQEDIIRAWRFFLRLRKEIYQSLLSINWNAPEWTASWQRVRPQYEGQESLTTDAIRAFLLSLPPAVVPEEAHTMRKRQAWVNTWRFVPSWLKSFKPMDDADSARCLAAWKELVDRLRPLLPDGYIPIASTTHWQHGLFTV